MSFNICAEDKHVWKHQKKVRCIGVIPGEIPAIKRCKVCKLSRLYDMAKKTGKTPKLSNAVITKDVDGFGIRMFVRDMIMPKIIEAVRDKSSSLRDGLREALGLE